MFSFLNRNDQRSHYKVDFHSHLIPGIDDGVKDYEESLEIIRKLSEFGYRKIITTPHIHSEYYPNTEEEILENYSSLNENLKKENLDIELEVAAEYYADETFIHKINANHRFLTFGDNYILIETAFINKPVFLNAMIFDLHSKGYKVILAHPERYLYLQGHFEELEQLKNQGVYFQLNLGSLSGMYNPDVKRFAQKLIGKDLIDFVGTDCHRSNQLEYIRQSLGSRSYQKMKSSSILNDTL